MPDLPPQLMLHPLTQRAVDDYIASPAQALLITGPSGAGKASLARSIISGLLQLPRSIPEKYENYPYLRIIRPVEGKAIPIDSIRSLQHFLSLSIPGSHDDHIARVALIEDAHMLTIEAQNALLKTLEEPPADTVIILTAISTKSVLPTIESRVRQLAILPPTSDRLVAHFTSLGYSIENVQRALMLSGELPGLVTALLGQDSQHPLVVATTHARGILQSKTYERLLLVDSLSKQRQLCLEILFVLGQMSQAALRRRGDQKSQTRWQHIMRLSYTATEQLEHNAQTKLVLMSLMLAL